MSTRTSWWIHHPDGIRRRLSAGGVLVGREHDCDIVLRDPSASRRQVLLYLGPDGPRVVPLGRGQTRMHGAVIDSPAALLPGDRIELPGLELWVDAEEEEVPETSSAWLLEAGVGGLFGVGPYGCVVGGGATDDLSIAGCPPAALAFRVAQNRLVLETGAAATVDGERVGAGTIVQLRAGSRIKIGDAEVRVLIGGGDGSSTTAASAGSGTEEDALPHVVELKFLPRGGRLTVTIGAHNFSVYLTDRRCDLVACLLQPPDPYSGGEFIPDEVLLARVWPRQKSSLANLSVLLHRVRKDLLAAEIDGSTLIARPTGGGAARFAMRAGAEIRIV
jgi:pSer/pThr/pTyr-binding forkhead associated (FHA) protein